MKKHQIAATDQLPQFTRPSKMSGRLGRSLLLVSTGAAASTWVNQFVRSRVKSQDTIEGLERAINKGFSIIESLISRANRFSGEDQERLLRKTGELRRELIASLARSTARASSGQTQPGAVGNHSASSQLATSHA